MYLPFRLLYREYNEVVGSLREDFVAEILKMQNKQSYYLKSTRGEKTPDFLVKENDQEMVIEVGGKGKGRQQFKGIKTKQKLRLVVYL